MGMVSQKLRDSAKGQECFLRLPGICSHNRETTVLCHAPSEFRGMGSKGHDFHAAFGCSECHQAMDQTRIPKLEWWETWLRAMQRTQAWWVENGLITIAGDTGKTRPGKKANMPSKKQTKAKASGKIVQRRHIATGELIDDRD
jgi:hypothetical protein